jgi:O-methyltransferase involved in polyketide biosynthesis
MSVWPYMIPPVASARIYDYLAGGKDNFAADRRLAEQMLAAHPDHLALVEANNRFVAQAVEDLAHEGITQYLVLGCGMPRIDETSVHEIVQDVQPTNAVFYVDRDLEVVAAARAHYHGAPNVRVVDGDLADIDALLADPGLHAGLDPDRPVAVVCALTAQHLRDDDVADLARGLHTALPTGSRLVVTHPAGEPATWAADAYTAGARAAGVDDRYLTRTGSQLDHLLKGWALDIRVADCGLITVAGHLGEDR